MTTDAPRVPVWIRAALFIVLVPGAIAGWLPWYWGGYPSPKLTGPLGIVGAALAIAGWGVLLSCARDFAVRGRGTPAGYAALVAAGFHLRVVMFEEPRLRELFGKSYSE